MTPRFRRIRNIGIAAVVALVGVWGLPSAALRLGQGQLLAVALTRGVALSIPSAFGDRSPTVVCLSQFVAGDERDPTEAVISAIGATVSGRVVAGSDCRTEALRPAFDTSLVVHQASGLRGIRVWTAAPGNSFVWQRTSIQVGYYMHGLAAAVWDCRALWRITRWDVNDCRQISVS